MSTAVKTCFRCGAAKPLTEFYRHPMMADGRLGKCRECTRGDVRQNRERRIDYYRQYDRARGFRVYDTRKVAARMATRSLSRKPCEVCGAEKTEAHHDDYARPLDVRWLCKRHHAEVHTRRNYD